MKIYYYCYCIEEFQSKDQYLFDIKPIISALTSWKKSLAIATRLIKDNEHLYLLPIQKNYYLFVQTKENDVIKRIHTETNSINASELVDSLNNDESLGFASYVLFDPEKNLFAFANRLSSPRVTAFKDFFNDMFMLLGEGQLSLVTTQMTTTSSKESAMNKQFLGNTKITVNKDNKLFKHVADYLVGEAIDRDIIENIEVILRPALRQNIRQSVGRAINKIEKEGLEGIVVKAKDDVEEPLKNLYVVTSGPIFDEIDSIDEGLIYQKMSDGLAQNHDLAEKVKEYFEKNEFSVNNLDRLAVYHDPDTWPEF